MHSTARPPAKTTNRLYSLIIAVVCVTTVGAADFPYRLQQSDIAVGLAATTLFGTGLLLEYRANSPPGISRGSLRTTDINRIDRSAVHQWAPGVDKLSDYATAAVLIAPAAAGIPLLCDREWTNCATLAVMYGEAVLLTAGLSATVKELTHRNRPYLYNAAFSESEFADRAADVDSRRSFFSQHTAFAFCSAFFLSTTATDIYGPSKATAAAWIASCAAAGAIGVSRYAAGQHFPTDILAGAAVGSLAGYGIPRLHRNKNLRVSAAAAGNRLVMQWLF